MIRPLMRLILHIQPDDSSIRVLAPHNPSFDTQKNLAPFHAVGVKPRTPLLKVVPRTYTPCDGIPASLGSSLLWHIANFDYQLGRLVCEHLGKSFCSGVKWSYCGRGLNGKIRV